MIGTEEVSVPLPGDFSKKERAVLFLKVQAALFQDEEARFLWPDRAVVSRRLAARFELHEGRILVSSPHGAETVRAALEGALEEMSTGGGLDDYERLCLTLRHDVVVRVGDVKVAGRALYLSPDGELVVKSSDRIVHLIDPLLRPEVEIVASSAMGKRKV